MAIFNTVPPLKAGSGIQFDGERISTAAAPRNWLDNSDFTNLVAQAEIGDKHGSVAYAADRWKLTSGTVTYTAGTGLTLNGTITQVLEKAPTGGSCFVGMASGTATIALNGNTITITSSGGVIKWAALYAEKYTEATKPEYQPKGYGAELLECQRYFLPDCVRYANGVAYGGRNHANILIHTPVKMRGGQINVKSKDWLVAKSTLYETSSIVGIAAIDNGVIAQVNVTSTFAENTQCCIANVVADIIADL